MKFLNYARKRGLALFMALIMCVSLLPAQALAAELTNDFSDGQQQSEWTQLSVNDIQTLLGKVDDKDPITFTVSELAEKINTKLTINGVEKTVTALGIGPNQNVTELPTNDGSVSYTLGTDGTVSMNPVTYMVTWNFNDGATQAEITPVEAGACPSHTDPTRTGYTFTGWQSGEVVYGGATEHAFPAVAGDVTYIAQWEEATPIESTTYTVTYTDGVEGEGIFADQMISDLEPGAKTPAFAGTFTREGYTFTGWAPAVAETVTEDVTYTACWNKSLEDAVFDDDSLDSSMLKDGTPDTDAPTPPASTPADGEKSSVNEEQDGIKAPDDMETMERSVTSDSEVPVYLWAKFAARLTEKEETSGLGIVEAKVSDGTNVVSTKDPISIVWNKTETLTVTVSFTAGETGKEIELEFQPGLKATLVSSVGEQHPAVTGCTEKKTTSPDSWDGYKGISGQKFVFAVKDDATSASLDFTLSIDQTLWDQRSGWIIPNALTITAREGSSEKSFSTDAKAITDSGTDVAPNYYFERNTLISKAENVEFTLGKQSIRTQNKGNFFSKYTAKVYLPYIEVKGTDGTSSRVYAEYVRAELSTYLGTKGYSTEAVVEEQEDANGKYVVLTWENVYHGGNFMPITPYFKWGTGSLKGIAARQEVSYRLPEISATYTYSTEAWTVTRELEDKDKIYISDAEEPGDNTYLDTGRPATEAGRYNWHWENPDLVYHFKNFYLKNNSLGTTGPQMVEFLYGETEQIGVTQQNIPLGIVPTAESPVKIWVKSTNSQSWIYKGVIDGTSKENSIGTVVNEGSLENQGYIKLTRERLGLTDDEYITGIRALVPGYCGEYQSYPGTGAAGVNGGSVFGRMLTDDTAELTDWASMSVTSAGNGVNVDNETGELTGSNEEPVAKTHLTHISLQRNQSPTFSPQFTGKFEGNVNLEAGGVSREYNATLQFPNEHNKNSLYAPNPEFELTLPAGITLDSYVLDVKGTNNYKEGSPTHKLSDSRVNSDGSTTYTITTGNLGLGWRTEETDVSTSISLRLKLNAGLGSQFAPLNMSNCLSVKLQGKSGDTPYVQAVSNGSITIASAPKALMLVGGKMNTQTKKLEVNPIQSVDRSNTSFTVTFSTWNNAEATVTDSNSLQKFVYYIPVPQADVETSYTSGTPSFGLELAGVECRSNKVQVAYTSESIADPKKINNWTPTMNPSSGVRWIKVTATGGVAPGETGEIAVSYKVTDSSQLTKDATLQFFARGTAVFPTTGTNELALTTDAVNVRVNSADYTVEYYYDGQQGTAPTGNSAGGTVVAGDSASVELPDTAVYNGKQYMLAYHEVVDAPAARKARAISVEISNITSNKVLRAYYMLDQDPIDPSQPGDRVPDKYQYTVTYTVSNGTWKDYDSNFFAKTTDGKLIHKYDRYELPEGGNWAMEETQLVFKTPKLEKIPESSAATGYYKGSWSGTTPTAETSVTADVTYAYSYSGYYTTKVSFYKLDGTGQQTAWEGKEAVSKQWDINASYTCDTLNSTITDGSAKYILYRVEGNLSGEMPAGTQPGGTVEIKAVYALSSNTEGDPVPDYLRKTVTFTVADGSWEDATDTTLTKVYILGTKNKDDTWTEELNKTLGDTIPTGKPTDNTYAPKGDNDGWSPAKPTADTLVTVHDAYTLTYEKKTATLTFDLNGGSKLVKNGTDVVERTVSSNVGDTATLKDYAAAKHAAQNETAVVFVGWSSEKDTTIYSKDSETQPTTINNIKMDTDKTVYAVWGLDSDGNGKPDISETWYSVTFDTAGGTPAAIDAQSIANGEKATKPNDPSKTGYTFTGWYKDSAEWNFGSNVVNGDIKLTAKYTANKYTVTFNAGEGAAVSPASKEVTYDATYGELPTPTWAGHVFAGWFTEAAAGTEVKAATSVTTAKDHTLYAHWTEKGTLTIDGNAQEGIYNGRQHSFNVTSTSGVTDFTVKYLVNGQWSADAPKNAGTYDVKVTRAEDSAYKAFEQTINGGLVIKPKAVTVTVTINDKIYDGQKSAAVISAVVNDVVSGDTVAATCTAEFEDKNVGTGKTISITSVTLNDPNYTWDNTKQLIATGTITPAPLTVTGVTAEVIKPYDGTTAVKQTYTLTFSGNVENDNVSLTYVSAAYAYADVSDSVNVTFSGIAINGADQDNYTVGPSYTATGKITAHNDHTYTVNYLEQGENGADDVVLTTAKTVTNAVSQSTVEETAIDIEGYVKPNPDKQSIKIDVTDNVINFYYTKRTDLSYTVNYLRAGTNAVLAEAKTVDGQTFKANVTENAIEIIGYSVDEGTKGCAIAVEGNVINFYYTPIEYTITYDWAGGTVAGNRTTYTVETDAFTLINPTRDSYTFTGWTGTGLTSASTSVTVAAGSTGDRTYTANWRLNGGTSIPDPYDPPYTPAPTPTPTPTIPDNPVPLDPGTTIMDQDVPLAGAVGLNNTDHFAYIAGYADDTVRPTKNISRAEVATIFFRLMTEGFRVANWTTENDLKDVQAGDWYNNAVSTCANAGIIIGYAGGRFQPQKDITRAEFAAIAARFLGDDITDDGVGDFTDTANHWAAADIRKAAKAGWITGDGNKFRPNDPITRAEVIVIVNRMLDRTPDAEHMLPDMKTWIDNPEGTWYYVDVQEATNGHDYERNELNVETWTSIQAKKDWAEIEAEWAANSGASAPKDGAQPVESDGENE